jgi:adenine-specific DNA-methyltransferase
MSKEQSPIDYLDREELISLVRELQEELLMSRAFSTFSESSSHDATLQWRGRNRFLSEKIIPAVLKPISELSFHPELGNNRIIEGDNLAVMTSLRLDFRGKIDVIYLDPPYNTGEDSFAYSDDYKFSNAEVQDLRRRARPAESFVSLDDPSRHTKWINHMAPRLYAARKLLSNTGVVIISIDEHELPRLWMLMEEMFGEKNRIATLIWERSRKNDAKYISEGHEYMLVWARNKDELDTRAALLANTLEWKNDKGRWRKRKDGADVILTAYAEAKSEYGNDIDSIQRVIDELFLDLPKDHPAHAIRYKKVNKLGVYNDDGDLSWPGGGGPRYEIIHPTTGKPCKIPTRGWAFKEEEMTRLINEGRIAFKANHNGIPRLITYLHEMENEVRTSVISRSGQRSVEVLESILGKGAFKNPKDHEILAELFNLVTWRNKKSIVLDAYAGTGTTAHSVISLNAEDGGSRRFILIESGDTSARSKAARSRYTNEITAERVRRVINGQWANGKEQATHNSGFEYFRAGGSITRRAIMESTRESLADIILQVVEEESNRVDCRVEGHTYLIGKTRLGYGIALVWDVSKQLKEEQILTWQILEQILDEAEAAGLTKPVHIYATAKNAPIADELYRFHQIPDAILARLGIIDGDTEVDEDEL